MPAPQQRKTMARVSFTREMPRVVLIIDPPPPAIEEPETALEEGMFFGLEDTDENSGLVVLI